MCIRYRLSPCSRKFFISNVAVVEWKSVWVVQVEFLFVGESNTFPFLHPVRLETLNFALCTILLARDSVSLSIVDRNLKVQRTRWTFRAFAAMLGSPSNFARCQCWIWDEANNDSFLSFWWWRSSTTSFPPVSRRFY